MKIGELLKKAYDELKEVNIESYMLDSQLLLSYVLKKDKLFIITNRNTEVDEELMKEFFKLIAYRKNKMPVKYILKSCEFMGLDFNVREGVLIPRPDTEILVEDVIKEIKENNLNNIIDVCTGSGAIGVSIAHYIDNVEVVCLDISNIAIEVCSENILKFNLKDRVKVFKSDLLKEALNKDEKYDVIVSNPPYIKRDVIPTLMKDVKAYEPNIALDGGEDGLDFYRAITSQSLRILKHGGVLAYEIGYDQGETVKEILINSGFKDVQCIKDLSGNDRVVKGKLV